MIFDYFLQINLDQQNTGTKLNTTNSKDEIPSPELVYRYPHTEPDEDDKPILSHQITQFCFPDGLSFPCKSLNKKNKYFTFVLTNVNGKKRYGHCRRFLIGKVTGSDKRWAAALCFLSVHDCNSFFESVLDDMERFLDAGDDMEHFLRTLQGINLPDPGESISFDLGECSYHFERSSVSFFGNEYFGVLFDKMDCFTIVSLFISMLLERRIIFFSNSVSVLTACVHAASTFLHPFQWQHVFIPVLPPSMLDIVCAPMPFILGCLSIYGDTISNMPLEEVIFVDLDAGLMMPHPRDYQLLHHHFLHLLASDIHSVRTEYRTLKKSSKRLIREYAPEFNFKKLENGFLQFFIDMLYTYQNYFNEDKTNFETDEFLAGGENSPIKEFLVNFATSQMFNMFIDERLNNGFDTEFDHLIRDGLERSSPNSELVFKEGWLLKKGGTSKNVWQERYFLLAPKKLLYKKSKVGDPVGSIDLENIDSVELLRGSSKSILMLHTDEKNYELSCGNEQALETWEQFIVYRVGVKKSIFSMITSKDVNSEVKEKGTSALQGLSSLVSSVGKKKKKEGHTEEHKQNIQDFILSSPQTDTMIMDPKINMYMNELYVHNEDTSNMTLIKSASDDLMVKKPQKKASNNLLKKIRKFALSENEDESKKKKKDKKSHDDSRKTKYLSLSSSRRKTRQTMLNVPVDMLPDIDLESQETV
eukprot:TRINITY_DN4768_c0_g1_i1.p1 TRINITY_DN4768_c0_g1~~TRINITY_DN4768_c0_g1_i1.p1  ORF type:complete len:700 (-),score=131.40 TRINITY_DN4768_c0_g1_i1:14-2113(-)